MMSQSNQNKMQEPHLKSQEICIFRVLQPIDMEHQPLFEVRMQSQKCKGKTSVQLFYSGIASLLAIMFAVSVVVAGSYSPLSSNNTSFLEEGEEGATCSPEKKLASDRVIGRLKAAQGSHWVCSLHQMLEFGLWAKKTLNVFPVFASYVRIKSWRNLPPTIKRIEVFFFL